MTVLQETDRTTCVFYVFFLVAPETNVSALIVNVYFKLWMKKGKCWGKGKVVNTK